MKNIQDKHIFAVLGGDTRQRTVAKRLIDKGACVRTFGLLECESISGAEVCGTAERAVRHCDAIILPLPASRDGASLSTMDQNIPQTMLFEIISLAKKHKVRYILGGMLPEDFVEQCGEQGIEVFDYYKRESLQEKNALPSAEGALMVAMENTDITVFGMKTLICGFGRIGKKLAYILKRLGASVTVAARRDEVICEAILCGYDTLKIDGDFYVGCEYNVIFNTVPAVIFNEKALSETNGNTVYVEIASKPGGIDAAVARKRQLKVINAPSLPGKYSPVSAGEYIFETVAEILAEGGMIL